MRSLPRRLLSEIAAEARYQYRRITRPRIIWERGIRLPLDHASYTATVLDALYRGSYESHEAAMVTQVLEPDDVVLEFGTGIGYISTLCCKKVKSHGQVHSFEANPLLIPLIQDTYKLNNVAPILHHSAIGKESGIAELFMNADFWLSSTRAQNGTNKMIVPCTAIDDAIKEIKPSMIVCDIEGAEIGLFDNAPLGDVNKIIIEVHPEVTGKLSVRELIQRFFDASLVMDTSISGGNRFYLHR
jgi:FkbM family methyltransferase